MLSWYNLGGLIRGYADGGAIADDTAAVSATDLLINDPTPTTSGSTAVYNNQYAPELTGQTGGYALPAGNAGFGDAIVTPEQTSSFQQVHPTGFTTDVLQPGENLLGDEYQVAADPLINAETSGYTFTDPVNPANPQDNAGAELIYTAPEDAVFAPPPPPPPVGVPVGGSPVQSYFSAGQPGVNTGIPQGGHAADAIATYLAGGAPGGYQSSYQSGANEDLVTSWETDAGDIAQGLSDQADIYEAANVIPETGGGNDDVVLDPTGTIDTLGGDTIAYDNAFEQPLAENIASIIEEGGINPETGDANIVAGPNVLSAADEGAFGFGSDYNSEFQENYEAQLEHSNNNPTGQTTGTPLYDQGYVGLGVDPLGDTIGSIVNNSTIGTIGTALTGEPLMADITSLLPPEESFSNYNSGDDSPSAAEIAANNNDGDPTNDTGNAGWGFTSFTDLFDGGGPGTSGDSYSGGIHGDDTVGDTSEGVGSIVSSWFGGGSDDRGGSDDSGGDSGGSDDSGGTWCCTAAYKHGMPIRKIKELRKWHRSMPQFWQDGYDAYGNWIANNLVKGSPFWSRVTEAGHTAFVERRITPMSSLAVLVIAPGSIAVGLYKQFTRRKADARS